MVDNIVTTPSGTFVSQSLYAAAVDAPGFERTAAQQATFVAALKTNAVRTNIFEMNAFFQGAETAPHIKVTEISGSITKLVDNTSYLIAGPTMTVVSNSNGSITLDAGDNFPNGITISGSLDFSGTNGGAPSVMISGSVDISGTLGATATPWITTHAYAFPQATLRFVPWPNDSEATLITDLAGAGVAIAAGELHEVHMSGSSAGGITIMGFHTNENTTAIETVTLNHAVAEQHLVFVFSASNFNAFDKLHVSVDPTDAMSDVHIAMTWHIDTTSGSFFQTD